MSNGSENPQDNTPQVPETPPDERPAPDPTLVDYQTEGLDDSVIEKR